MLETGDRSKWPFPALLPFHLKAYPVPQSLPVVGPQDRRHWPFPMRPGLVRWSQATRHIASAGNHLYVHVPFCPFFCDFCPLYKSTKARHQNAAARAAYVETLLREIAFYANAPFLEGTVFDAVYFGGGTPTELTSGEVARILGALRSSFPIAPTAEITLEGVSAQFRVPGKLEGYVEAGVNRISYGVQTLNPELRKAIGRTDGVEDQAELAALAKSRFPSVCVNIDLMANLPGQTLDSFTRDLEEVARWPLDSIDVIPYIMFPGTGLYRRILDGRRQAPSYGESLLRFRRSTSRTLAAFGFRGITGDAYVRGASEVCLPTALGGGGNGLNTVLGLGPSSWGLIQGTAYRNVPDLDLYHEAVNAGRFPVDRATRLDTETARLRAQILGIALLGSHLDLVRGSPAEAKFRSWRKLGLLEEAGERWRVTEEGRMWYNQMQLELLPLSARLKLVRMLGSPGDQETFFRKDAGGLAVIGDEISRFVKQSGPAATARWLGYRGYLKLLKTPLFDSRAVGWNGATDPAPKSRNMQKPTFPE